MTLLRSTRSSCATPPAQAGVKVLLSGMGADELFGGYRKHLACVMAARYQGLPSALRSGVHKGVGMPPGHGPRSRAPLCPLGEAVPDVCRAARRRGFPPQLHALRPSAARRPAQP